MISIGFGIQNLFANFEFLNHPDQSLIDKNEKYSSIIFTKCCFNLVRII